MTKALVVYKQLSTSGMREKMPCLQLNEGTDLILPEGEGQQ